VALGVAAGAWALGVTADAWALGVTADAWATKALRCSAGTGARRVMRQTT